jgi:predicted RNA-binding protein YlxR (DUF448 family)
VRDKRELVRVAHTPEDRFALDATGKLPGRGAYLCPSEACLSLALKRKSFDRAFRQAVPAEAVRSLGAEIQELLRARTGAAGPDQAESPERSEHRES